MMNNYSFDAKNLTPWEQSTQANNNHQNILIKFRKNKNSSQLSNQLANKSRLLKSPQKFAQMIIKKKDNILKKLEQKSKKQVQSILGLNLPRSDSNHKIIQLKQVFPNYSLQLLKKKNVFNKSESCNDSSPQQQNFVVFRKNYIQSELKRSRTKQMFGKKNKFSKYKFIPLLSHNQSKRDLINKNKKIKTINNVNQSSFNDNLIQQFIKHQQKSKEKSWEQRFRRINSQLNRYSATECYKSKKNAYVALPKIQLIELNNLCT